MATITLSAIESIVYHDLWAASLVVNPSSCGFSFLSQDASHDVKAKGAALVRKMLQKLSLQVQTKNLNSSDVCREPVPSVGSNLEASKWLLKSKMCLADMCEDDEELSSFQRVGLTTLEKELLREEEGVVQFCIDKASSHSLLSRVPLRISDTSATSCPSERNFRYS